MKAKAKAKKAKVDEDEDYEEEDAYTALVKDSYKSTRPPIGNFENCAKCEQLFTVVCHPRLYFSGVALTPLRPNTPWPRYPLQDSCATSAQSPQGSTPLRSLLLLGSAKHLRINARSFISKN